MLLVILGAGASFDSLSPSVAGPPSILDHTNSSRFYRPPLASQLCDRNRQNFGEAIDRWTPCRPIIDRLRRLQTSDGGSLEEELEQIATEAQASAGLQRQLLAFRYYLRDVIAECGKEWSAAAHGVTNYVTLVSSVEAWRASRSEQVLFITFNYDTLLEDALADVVGLHLDTLNDYTEGPDYFLVKPHGSINWAHRLEQTVETRADLFGLAQPTWTEDFLVVPEHAWGDIGNVSNRAVLAPALTVPVRTKSNFECPPEHLQQLSRLLHEVSRVLIIGWRGLERHFLEQVEHGAMRTDRRVVVAESREAALATMHNIRRAFGQGDSTAPMGAWEGFSGFLEQGGLKEFLAW